VNIIELINQYLDWYILIWMSTTLARYNNYLDENKDDGMDKKIGAFIGLIINGMIWPVVILASFFRRLL